MCTIGSTLNNELIIFKNCDLIKETKFYKPKIRKGKYKYLAFARRGKPGLWAGINQFGLGIVAADTYTKKKYRAKPYTLYNIFKGYEKTVSDFKNVDEAINFLKEHYKNKIKVVPDLIIVADRNQMAVFEFIPPDKFGIRIKNKGYILRTNQFRILKGGRDENEDPESYIRLNNALKIIQKNDSLSSIKRLCKNHKNGPGKFSICRHGKTEEHKTQASVIMTAGKEVKAYFIVNNFPCKGKYQEVKLC